ncbi:uncharacterized protein LOC110603215 [Manihot esculenta]|uniref:uncharacterized protein LOC110603215 n=1 Tax=Manihot esculenta TaxID=3983 RepID=UPI000B5D9320|nr:uncharacterized protein LOC110603215 [Manihot esculenta]
MNLKEAGHYRKLQLQELEEIRRDAYDTSWDYKTKIKASHDNRISRKHFEVGKLRSRWIGPFIVEHTHPHGAVDIRSIDTGKQFKVNGHRLKPFYEGFTVQLVEEIPLNRHSL